jgi:hypothetical protein
MASKGKAMSGTVPTKKTGKPSTKGSKTAVANPSKKSFPSKGRKTSK